MGTAPLFGSSIAAAAAPPPQPPHGRAGRGHGGGACGHVRLQDEGRAANSPSAVPIGGPPGAPRGSSPAGWAPGGVLVPTRGREPGAGRGAAAFGAGRSRTRGAPPSAAGRRCRPSSAVLCARSRGPASPRPGPNPDRRAERCRGTPGSPRRSPPRTAAPHLRARRRRPAAPAQGRSLRGLSGRLRAAGGGTHRALRFVPHITAPGEADGRALPFPSPHGPHPRPPRAALARDAGMCGFGVTAHAGDGAAMGCAGIGAAWCGIPGSGRLSLAQSVRLRLTLRRGRRAAGPPVGKGASVAPPRAAPPDRPTAAAPVPPHRSSPAWASATPSTRGSRARSC